MKKLLVCSGAALLSIHAYAAPAYAIAPYDLERAASTVSVTGAGSRQDGGKNKDRETVSVVAADANGPVSGTACKLSNDKGAWTVTTPDTVIVQRSDSDLKIECTKAGYETATGALKPELKQITKTHFHFSAEGSGDDDDDEQYITVEQYLPDITVRLTAANSGSPKN